MRNQCAQRAKRRASFNPQELDELATAHLVEGARLALEQYAKADVAALLRRLAEIVETPIDVR